MASTSTTLALCSSFTSQCKLAHYFHTTQHSLPLSKPNFASFSSTSQRLTSSSALCPRPALLARPRCSASETAVAETEPDAPEPETQPEPAASAQVVEVAKEEPKREEIFAVVIIGGRQYIVIPGRFYTVTRLKGANVNDKIALHKVLLVGTKTTTYIGRPIVTNAVVHAIVEDQGLDPKKVVFKYKKKKNYRRKIGHRQPNTRIRITSIDGYQDYPAVTLDSLKEAQEAAALKEAAAKS
ncbi:hypothetical protein Tsubulata_037917 [Turnera subulata]|uniref:50S ribosomal protein L21, chloroplastic n=1 Tax=Turnera subulata TaxID=218843 RepID=A0A9Q0G8J4_9ROSI|nr:hypothetical protein Tsubulata_037917 [Turnera subulata]